MKYCNAVVLVLALARSLALAGAAHAAWLPQGTPVHTGPNDQRPAAVVEDGAAGAFVVSYGSLPADPVHLQHLDLAGNFAAGWTAAGIDLPSTSSSSGIRVANDLPRGVFFIVATSTGPGSILRMWRQPLDGLISPPWDASGVALPMPAGTTSMDAIALAPDGSGGAFCTQVSNNRFLWLVHVRADGTLDPAWPANGVLLSSTIFGVGPILADGAGGVYVVDVRGSLSFPPYGLLRHVKANGLDDPAWPLHGRILTSLLGGGDGNFDIMADGAGGTIVVFGHSADGVAPGTLLAQRVTGTGAIAPGWPAAGATIGTTPFDVFSFDPAGALVQLIPDGAGGGIARWTTQTLAGNYESRLVRFTGAGTVAPGWSDAGLVPLLTTDNLLHGTMVADGSGGAYLASSLQAPTTPFLAYDARLQHVDLNGTTGFWPPAGLPVGPSSVNRQNLLIAPSYAGLIATWADHRDSATSGYDVYATRLDYNGAVGVTAALVSADATPERVRLEWRLNGAAGVSATLERHAQGAGWEVRGTFVADADGQLVAQDADVAAGAQYAYRLGWLEGDTQRYGPEAWVTVPNGAALSLSGFSPNPSPGMAHVSFSLASGEPATLEVLDIAGRSVLRQEVGALGAGRHVVPLAGALSPGVYLMRLQQGARVQQARGAVVR